MTETLLIVQIVIAGLALGMGLYLLVRSRGEGVPLLPGLALLSFALAMGCDAFANYISAPDTRFVLSLLSTVLVVLTLLLAAGVLMALQHRPMLQAWRYGTYGATLLVMAGTFGLLLTADLGTRIAAVLAAGAGLLLLALAATRATATAE
jgi:hypothetical protein